MSDPGPAAPTFRSGYVALVGQPNVGKSTLLNRLVGQRLSITTPRPQTTRLRILGILNGPGHQAVIVDTPGVLEPRYKLQEMMCQEIAHALRDADIVLAMLDAKRFEPEIIRRAAAGRRTLFVVNKVDLVPRERLLAMVERLAGRAGERVFLVSALKGDGVDDLRTALVASLPEGPPFYPPDMVTERPERFFVAEIVRESIFHLYGEEIPYSTAVAVDEFSERDGRKDYIRAIIYVERVGQRKIIIGKGGEALKRVGSSARRSIEAFLGRPVYLELWVKVADDWRRDERFIRETLYRDG